MAKAFASQGDMSEKKISFTEVGEGLYAFTAEGDPNSGVIIGDDSVMIVEAQATPRLANKVIEKVREVTDKPITHVVLTHYHAVRVLGASGYGASEIIMSQDTRDLVAERGHDCGIGRHAGLVGLMAQAVGVNQVRALRREVAGGGGFSRSDASGQTNHNHGGS